MTQIHSPLVEHLGESLHPLQDVSESILQRRVVPKGHRVDGRCRELEVQCGLAPPVLLLRVLRQPDLGFQLAVQEIVVDLMVVAQPRPVDLRFQPSKHLAVEPLLLLEGLRAVGAQLVVPLVTPQEGADLRSDLQHPLQNAIDQLLQPAPLVELV
jgi:hypothetical protein